MGAAAIENTRGLSRAVVESRREPHDSLEFFPTPPWATRALVKHVLGPATLADAAIWEPAAGEGHMAEVLREFATWVTASDVHDYGRGHTIGSFVGAGPDVLDPTDVGFEPGEFVDWIITNPPFRLAGQFVERGLEVTAKGVALFLRLNWVDTLNRYNDIFANNPPTRIAVFAERVPLHKGRWEPDGSTATIYAWFVWQHDHMIPDRRGGAWPTFFQWIPPGCREHLERDADRARFAPHWRDPNQAELFNRDGGEEQA